MENKTSYSDAINEIEAILARFEREEFDVDTLAANVRRATELIDLCRKKLRKAEDDVAKALKDTRE
ncbi:MAG: exodeoxyribonuclease VII small subunit [Rikenellaceae bacterium]|nr:exodeoxyribonuclease VII small subunit [Rikenellaceae bacterium]MCL2693256.1 exodeoxyribonuclease VII small subunit [Rikenellaceae bacterium]